MSAKKPSFAVIPYGFRYGAVRVERCGSHLGHVFLTLYTPRQQLEVRITPTGLIRPGDVEKVLSFRQSFIAEERPL